MDFSDRFRGLERSFASFESMERALKDQGCAYALVKPLAANQDNEKNQIYLGAESGFSQLLPGTSGVRRASGSLHKTYSKPGRLITELKLDFSWLWPDDRPCPAPSARIIDYFQYARDGETRLSGFLQGCSRGPRALRRQEMDAYGRRVLVLGVSESRVFGIVVTDVDGKLLINRLHGLPPVHGHPVLQRWDLRVDRSILDVNRLLGDLRSISGRELVACELRSAAEGRIPRRAQQGGGWTLEAYLGISRNSVSGPDKHGFEIKSVGGSQVTLITTEPDLGARSESFTDYMCRFGWDSPGRPGHRVFNGSHRVGKVNPRSHARLEIDHWDSERNAPTGSGEPRVLLVDTRTDEIIAGWTFAKLAGAWTKKHAGAVYVETTPFYCDEGTFPSHYRFGPTACVGTGTNVLRYLQRLGSGDVRLDPGDSMDPGGTQKRRTQWRVAGRITEKLPEQLRPLYNSFEVHRLQ